MQATIEIEISVTREPLHWKASPTFVHHASVQEVNTLLHLQGRGVDSPHEAVGELLIKMKEIPICVKRIYINKHNRHTANYCLANGLHQEDL
jgi:hypothetical protein